MSNTISKYGAIVTTVDPAQNLVEFALKTGDLRRLTLATTPAFWRWPQVGDQIMVRQENGSWLLDEWFETYPSADAGDAVITAPTGLVRVVGSSEGNSDFTLSKNTTGFRARRTTAYTAPTTGYVNLSADHIHYDLGSNYSVSTGLYTCPTAGLYQVQGQIRYSAFNSLGAIAIVHNGVASSEGVVGNTNVVGFQIADLLQCGASDTLGMFVFWSSSGAGNTLSISASDNYWSVIRIA